MLVSPEIIAPAHRVQRIVAGAAGQRLREKTGTAENRGVGVLQRAEEVNSIGVGGLARIAGREERGRGS